MRALCGAIITAAALIGLGLTSIGIGERYQREASQTADGHPVLIHLTGMDRPLVFVLVFLTIAAVIGVGITFVGLAYHHARRHREFEFERERHAAQQRTTV